MGDRIDSKESVDPFFMDSRNVSKDPMGSRNMSKEGISPEPHKGKIP